MLADDAKALVDKLGFTGLPPDGRVDGRHDRRRNTPSPIGGDLKSLTLACTYGKADPFCQTMFAMWADLAKAISVPFVMRDVALWAFTGPFFEDRPGDAAEFAAAMAALDDVAEAYLAQLAVIQTHDATDRLGQIKVPTLVLAGEEDILIPCGSPRSCSRPFPAPNGRPFPAGMPACGKRPTRSMPPSSTSSAVSDPRLTQSQEEVSCNQVRTTSTISGAKPCRTSPRSRSASWWPLPAPAMAQTIKDGGTCAPR